MGDGGRRGCPAPADHAAPGPRAQRANVHHHLGGRPPHRARTPLREPRPRRTCRARPQGRRGRLRSGDVALRGQLLSPGRPQRRGRAAERGVEHGAGPLRRDADRVFRHRGPGAGHGPRRHLRLAVLPLPHRRLRGDRVRQEQGPGAGPGLPAGLERLAPGGVGRSPPRPHHPPPVGLAGRPRGGRRRRAGQRRARLQGRQLPGEPRRFGAALHAHNALEPLPAGVRGDRHGRPARRWSCTRRSSR